MTRHTYLLFALMTFGSLSVSAQMSLGYYKFKDGAEYTGELKDVVQMEKAKQFLRMEIHTKVSM